VVEEKEVSFRAQMPNRISDIADATLILMLKVWNRFLSFCQEGSTAALVGVAMFGCGLVLSLVEFDLRVKIKPDQIDNPSGFQYTFVSPSSPSFGHIRSDTMKDPKGSRLRLYEDGIELGPRHSLHSDIAARGGGSFSQWHGYLYFSTSDNSDPRTNGRRYEAAYVIYVSRFLSLPPLLFGAIVLLFFLQRRLRVEQDNGTRIRFGEHETSVVTVMSLAVMCCIVFFGFSASISLEIAGSSLETIRTVVQWVTAGFVGIIGGALLGRLSSVERVHPMRLALLVLMLVALGYGVLDTKHGTVNYDPTFLYLVLTGLIVYFLSRSTSLRFVNGIRLNAIATWVDAIPVSDCSRPQLSSALLLATLLTIFQVIPEVVLYWDQSGWMDSQSYDKMAHQIAIGEAPFAYSDYMPLYQYGLAVLYWTFGHFFFVQQIFNILLAVATVCILTISVWLLFRNILAVWFVCLAAAHLELLHHAVWYTQIENWYIPIFAASVGAMAYYIQRRSTVAIIFLAVAAALIFNTRLQGAPYAVSLGLVVFFVAHVGLQERVKQLSVFVLVFVVLGLTPWSARNWHVDGNFSPSSAQSAVLLAVNNDPRIPFYGIRYWENADVVHRDWNTRFPNSEERLKEMRTYFWDRVKTDPGYFVEAAPWRFAAFFGLLPNQYLAMEGMLPFDWRSEWSGYLKHKLQFIVPIVLALIGLLVRYSSPMSLLMVGLVTANVLPTFTVGSAEPRLCYPTMILLLATSCAVFAPYQVAERRSGGWFSSILPHRSSVGVVVLIALTLAFVTHITVGASHARRELFANEWKLMDPVEIDQSLPFVTTNVGSTYLDGVEAPLVAGKSYRTRMELSNYMYPPKWVVGLGGVAPEISNRVSEQYYLAWLSPKDSACEHSEGSYSGVVGIRLLGAESTGPIREGTCVDVEFVVDRTVPSSWLPNWFQARKISLVNEAD